MQRENFPEEMNALSAFLITFGCGIFSQKSAELGVFIGSELGNENTSSGVMMRVLVFKVGVTVAVAEAIGIRVIVPDGVCEKVSTEF